VLVSILVTLASRIYKGGQGPSQNKISRSFYTKEIQTAIQDVGYYAPCGPNLSKSCVPCTFEFLISASPHPKLTTLGISLGGQPVKHRQLACQVGERIEDPPVNSIAVIFNRIHITWIPSNQAAATHFVCYDRPAYIGVGTRGVEEKEEPNSRLHLHLPICIFQVCTMLAAASVLIVFEFTINKEPGGGERADDPTSRAVPGDRYATRRLGMRSHASPCMRCQRRE
jgi:hypothetical protein